MKASLMTAAAYDVQVNLGVYTRHPAYTLLCRILEQGRYAADGDTITVTARAGSARVRSLPGGALRWWAEVTCGDTVTVFDLQGSRLTVL